MLGHSLIFLKKLSLKRWLLELFNVYFCPREDNKRCYCVPSTDKFLFLTGIFWLKYRILSLIEILTQIPQERTFSLSEVVYIYEAKGGMESDLIAFGPVP